MQFPSARQTLGVVQRKNVCLWTWHNTMSTVPASSCSPVVARSRGGCVDSFSGKEALPPSPRGTAAGGDRNTAGWRTLPFLVRGETMRTG